jgi:hypothetical protein
MSDSTLDLTPSAPLATGKGHGTRELGPSDSSDSGSDLQGPGIFEEDKEVNLPLDTGTYEDAAHGIGAGRDIGDSNLDSDSDSGGTGERAAAGRDIEKELGSDVAPDRIVGSVPPTPIDEFEDIAVDDDSPAGEEEEQ